MAHRSETELDRPGSAPRPAPGVVAWPRLLPSDRLSDVLQKLGGWLGPGVVGLRLDSTDRGEACLASWRAAATSRRRARPRKLVVRGEPQWFLTVGIAGPEAAERSLERAVLALELWREAHAALAGAERSLAARSGELDLIQALGRRAAEARTPCELFSSAAAVLERGQDLDLLLAAHLWDGAVEMAAFLTRPFSNPHVEAVARRAAGFLGQHQVPQVLPRFELDTYDTARGERAEFHDEELLLLPLLRRGQPAACLLVVVARALDDARLRLLYNAVNQLSVHLDRILAVREAEADRFRSIVDSMPQGVIVADLRLNVLQSNGSARQMLERGGVDLAAGLTAALERLGWLALVARVRQGDSLLEEGEAVLDGDRVWSATVSPLHGEGGRVEGLVLVLADVTAGRQMQLRLAHAEKLSSLGQMISGIAHELNNPLASILGYAQLLRATTGDGPLGERLELVRSEAERCRRIVQNLLSFARQREPERQPLSLNQVVHTTLGLLAYQLRVEDIRVESDLSPDLPPVRGDAHQLGQVLVNLLTNARQAIGQQGGGGTIVLRSACAGRSAVTLEVGDSGPGVPEPLRRKIFDPFFTTKQPGQGTGLGLALAYGIVTAHGGTLKLLPASGRGATFLLTLPCAEQTAKEGEPAAAAGRGGDRGAVLASPPAAGGRPGRILVVDDEEPLARLICDVLTADGHLMESAGDGSEALERLERGEFDLIISDIKMPGMGGERLHEALRRSKPALCRRLLLTTGDTLGSDAQGLAARTGLELLHKPFDLDDLRRRVRARLAMG